MQVAKATPNPTMALSHEQLIALVEKSAFLHERQGPLFRPADVIDAAAASVRLDRWKQTAGINDEDLFAKRLSADGFTAESATTLLSGVRWRGGDAILPNWTEYLQGGVARSETNSDSTPEEITAKLPFLDADEPLAFEHVISGFVEFASERVRERIGERVNLLSPRAWARLERNLAQWLAAVSAETIELEFSVFRTMRVSQAGAAVQAFGSFPLRTFYSAFVREMWCGRLISFVAEYPVLARLVGTLAHLWVESSSEFVRNLAQDYSAIEKAFQPEQPLGAIAELEPGISDRHCGGQTSFRVKFASGLELIYKPKNLASERLYYNLLEWLNSQNAGLHMPIFRAVYGHHHAWVEAVPHLPCGDIGAVHRYYERAGKLLCLMYCLEASDCHHENIIASGEYPVLIDMETLLQHRVALVEASGAEDASAAANRVFYWDSVFRTALLPRWEFGPRGESYDISGLGGVDEHVTPFKRKAWQHINTDAMKLKRESIKTAPSRNLVHFGDQRMKPAEFVEDLVKGFVDTYHLFTHSRDELFAPGGPLHAMKGLRLRFLYRHTKIYTAVLNSVLLPEHLRDGADASIQIDVLSRPLLYTDGPHPFWPILAVEEAALLRGDIPLFTAAADDTALEMENGSVIRGFFAEPSYNLLEKRFQNLSEDDLRVQLSYIRTCFHTSTDSTGEVPVVVDAADALASNQEFEAEALRIAHQIRDAAIRSTDGSATWITLAYHAEAQRWQLQPMTPRLYDGVGGPVLLLAAAARVSGDSRLRDAAFAGIKTIMAALSSSATVRLLAEPGIGAGLGIGSLPYSLVQAALLLGSEDLLDGAQRSLDILTLDRIHEDARLDLLGGAAGALLAATTVYRVRPGEQRLLQALACGDHLLATRITEGPAHGGWPTLNKAPLAGFSHGAAGISYALARLYEVNHDDRWLAAAREGCHYEDTLFSSEYSNWPDLRYPKTAKGYVFQNSWCHGAPGITLARVGGLPFLDDEKIRADIDYGLDATSRQPLLNIDHLCCGNLGRVETLLVAGEKLGREDLILRARQIGTHVLRRAQKTGRYGLGLSEGPYLPSFHQGMAGIGYQFLRLAHRQKLPSVLLWETQV
jgi:type 2 lantibiotic biosynthesis protein LanM